MSDSLRPHESQHARPPCPSPTPGVHSNSCPSSPWCHPAISSSVVPFFSCPPSIRVFSNESTLHMRWPKYWSFSFSIIPSKENPGLISFRMDWLDLLVIWYLSFSVWLTSLCMIGSRFTQLIRTDSKWEFAVCLRELKQGLSTNLEGWDGSGWGMTGRFKREGTYVYLWLIHVEVWQKTTKFCKAIIQLKKTKTKKTFTSSFHSVSLFVAT